MLAVVIVATVVKGPLMLLDVCTLTAAPFHGIIRSAAPSYYSTPALTVTPPVTRAVLKEARDPALTTTRPIFCVTPTKVMSNAPSGST